MTMIHRTSIKPVCKIEGMPEEHFSDVCFEPFSTKQRLENKPVRLYVNFKFDALNEVVNWYNWLTPRKATVDFGEEPVVWDNSPTKTKTLPVKLVIDEVSLVEYELALSFGEIRLVLEFSKYQFEFESNKETVSPE